MYIRTEDSEIYLVADNIDSARIGDVVVEEIDGENYYVPKAEKQYNNIEESFCIHFEDGEWKVNIPGDLAEVEHFLVSNCTIIDDQDLGSLIKQNNYDKIGTPIICSDDDIFAPEPTSSDNFLCTALKMALKKKNIPMKLYDDQFGKEHNKNNTIKAIRSGKVTEKKFIQVCDILGLDYGIILTDAEGVPHPMGEPVIHTTRNFKANDMVVDLIKSLKK